jgi:hypothetical protein
MFHAADATLVRQPSIRGSLTRAAGLVAGLISRAVRHLFR